MKPTRYRMAFRVSPGQRRGSILGAMFPSMSSIPGFVTKSLPVIPVILALVMGHAALTAHADEVKVTASDGAAGDQFGRSVSIDRDTIVVGALYDDDKSDNSGSAYVFSYDGNNGNK